MNTLSGVHVTCLGPKLALFGKAPGSLALAPARHLIRWGSGALVSEPNPR